MKWILPLLLLFLLGPRIALAEGFGLNDAVKKKGGITYMCTGIGESKHDPRIASFPLKIVFATNSSALYSDVNVRIYHEEGESVFDVFCDGAWLLVQLPSGSYRVTATDTKNQSRSCPVTLGGGQTQCVLRWPD